jgi:hypothetical protein
MWNGMTSHWFDNARDIIYESNTMTGVSLTAYGSNVDTCVVRSFFFFAL